MSEYTPKCSLSPTFASFADRCRPHGFQFASCLSHSTEWGTRDVGSFDSGITKKRTTENFWKKVFYLFWGFAISIAAGAIVSDSLYMYFNL